MPFGNLSTDPDKACLPVGMADALAVEMARGILGELPELTMAVLLEIWNRPFQRTGSEFKGFMKELGLADYWRRSGHWSDFCQAEGDDDFECFDKPVQR